MNNIDKFESVVKFGDDYAARFKMAYPTYRRELRYNAIGEIERREYENFNQESLYLRTHNILKGRSSPVATRNSSQIEEHKKAIEALIAAGDQRMSDEEIEHSLSEYEVMREQLL